MSKILQITELEFGYPRSEPLLHGVSLALERGQLIWITGPAGCGKSTLLQLICGNLKPQSGRIEIRGIPVYGRGSWSRSYLRRELGLFRQSETLLPERSLFANVELPLEIRGFRKGRRRQRVVQVLRSLDLFGRASLPAAQLSASERRLTTLARALVGSPPLILAELDSSTLDRGIVLDKLREAATYGSAVVIFAAKAGGPEPEYHLAGESVVAAV